jgi:hypothetical protein
VPKAQKHKYPKSKSHIFSANKQSITSKPKNKHENHKRATTKKGILNQNMNKKEKKRKEKV